MDNFVLKADERVCIKEYESVSIIGVTEDGRRAEVSFPAKDLYVELQQDLFEDRDVFNFATIQSKSKTTCIVKFTYTGCTFRFD